MSMRTGVAFPVGNATGKSGDTLSSRYSWQVPLGFDLGAKVTESIFLGAYVVFGIGAEGSDIRTEAYCDDDDSNLENDVSCTASTLKFGLEARYSFDPGERWSPWLGYGAGFETATSEIDDADDHYRESTTVHGFTVAKLSGGIDHRSGRTLGVGPFAEAAIGNFTQTVTRVNDQTTFDGAIEQPSWHAWLTLGVRLVLFP
jgi:opacity protein-like surface antigen